MKRLLMAASILFCLKSVAQTDTAKIPKIAYCEIVGVSKLMNMFQVNVSIDYGQEKSIWKGNWIKDEEGKIKTFNSMIDALNFMAKQGWEFVQAYAATMGNQNVYHYLLKRNL